MSVLSMRVRYLARAASQDPIAGLGAGLGAVNTVLGPVAMALVLQPVLVGVAAALTAVSALSAARQLAVLAPPVCWCGRRHWDEEDGDGDGGPIEYGKAA